MNQSPSEHWQDEEAVDHGDGVDALSDDATDYLPIAQWPDPERFPHNLPKQFGDERKAGEWIERDLEQGQNLLIITGFTSLTYLFTFFAKCWQRDDHKESIRLLIGYNVHPEKRRFAPVGGDVADEAIRGHLLRQRLSIYQCLDVLYAQQLFNEDHALIRTSPRGSNLVHAKIYQSDDWISFGSSNFSENGLEKLIEINKRAQRTEANAIEASQYAEQIWKICRNYKPRLQQLLGELLQEVSWQEALARGCAELLEGKWAKRYIESALQGQHLPLLPYQTQGVAEALYIIDTTGSVLIADATGSGKTRMGAMLMKSLVYKLLSDPARLRNAVPVLLSPPKIVATWEDTSHQCGVAPSLFSHGDMSNVNARKHASLLRALRQAQIVAIDEAHNFLNPQSLRSQALTRNFADYVLLFTATPINRDPADLFRIVALLGPDNFEDAVVNTLNEFAKKRGWQRQKYLSLVDTTSIFQDIVQRFTVRRTKRTINQIIDADQQGHRDAAGRICRYPEHFPRTYDCKGTTKDQQLAQEIYALAKQLRGMLWLRTPLQQANNNGRANQHVLDQRLRGAQGLASYMIMNSLRSSRVALIEHIEGTNAALAYAGLPASTKAETGFVLEKLRNIAGHPPQNFAVGANVPHWLEDAEAHRAACEAEIALYKQISAIAKKISSAREEAKAKHIESLLATHKHILAFDRYIIALCYIESLISKSLDCETLVVTGDTMAQTRKLRQWLDPDADDGRTTQTSSSSAVIGFCSDALSEGVNLQKASAVVHLDMPTVVVRAEQRLGRIERINSTYKRIESWWPKDSAAFAPRGDEKFIDRHYLVDDMIGANFELPPDFVPDHQEHSREQITPEKMFRELAAVAKRQKQEEPQEDVFAPIRALVLGDHPLIKASVYRDMVRQTEKITTSVSAIAAAEPWAFLSISGVIGSAPLLVYFDHLKASPVTQFTKLANSLHQKLNPTLQTRPYDQDAQTLVNQFIQRLERTQQQLLSQQKQRALDQMEFVLTRWLSSNLSLDQQESIKLLLNMLAPGTKVWGQGEGEKQMPNLNTLAERWLQAVRPIQQTYYDSLRSKRRLVRLDDIRSLLLQTPFRVDALQKLHRSEGLWVEQFGERVVAVIIGVPHTP